MAVDAVGLNFPDLLVCAGLYQERPELPFSPGFEAAGTVVEVGDGVDLPLGQRVVVVPELPNGALQESLTVPAGQLYPVPDTMPGPVAAALHIAYQTAHVALHHRAGARPGETVVVSGAAGGVGSAAVQLARAAGCQVIAVVTGPAKAAACRRWGADTVIDLSAGADLAERVKAATGGRGADVIIDVVGGDVFDGLRRCLAFEGRIVVVGFTGGGVPTLAVNRALLGNYSVLGLYLARYRRENPGLLRRVHQELVEMWEGGLIGPEIHAVLSMDRAPQALALVASRQVIGRVVLEV